MKKVTYIWLLLLFAVFPYQLMAQERPKVGVVLSGGGAKGFAHIPILKQLEKSGVQIDYIAGTSIGAIVGGLYATGYTADELEVLFKENNLNDLIFKNTKRENIPLFDKTYNEKYILSVPFDDFKFRIPNAISTSETSYLFLSQALLPAHNISNFDSLKIPFFCIATNLETGKEKIFDKGFLPKCVMASAALPSLIKPVTINDSLYIDGGLVNNFPANEMKARGMDIVIGIELGQDLRGKKDLSDVFDIMTQITDFSVKSGVKKQLNSVDVLIKPDLNSYDVTSFDDFDSIYTIGNQQAIRFKPVFDSIAKLQKFSKNNTILNTYKPSTYCIRRIKVYGNKQYNSDYIKGKLGFKDNDEIEPLQITNGFERLYDSGNYEQVDYKLKEVDGGYDMDISVKEKSNDADIKLGVHYDDVFKTGVLINLSLRNFIFRNTSASFDVVAGDKPRYYVNIFSNNGIKPSLGLTSQYMNIPIDISTTNNLVNFIKYNMHWYYNTFYVQSTLKEKYAIGLGMDHHYIRLNTRALNNNNPSQTLENSYYLGPQAYMRIDTQDNPSFPKSGIQFLGSAKYLFLSNQEDFRKSFHFFGNLNLAISPLKFLTFSQNVNLSFKADNDSFAFQNFYGGINQQKMLYIHPFIGYEFARFGNDNGISLQSRLQFNLIKNGYLLLIGNIANTEVNLEDIQFFKYSYTGVGTGLGYDSPIGPIYIQYSYSPQVKKNIINFALGYWF